VCVGVGGTGVNVCVGGGEVDEGVGWGVSVCVLIIAGSVSDGWSTTVGEDDAEQAVVRKKNRMIHGILLR
jgi:hypothetical protein